MDSRHRPPFARTLHLGLGAVQHLQKFCDTVSHSGVHVRFGAFDVVVEVVAEELDAKDGLLCELG